MDKKMIKVGTKVKLNIDGIFLNGYEGLTTQSNPDGTNYMDYIYENEETIFVVEAVLKEKGMHSPFVLNDDILKNTSFSENELIVIEEKKVVCFRCENEVGKSKVEGYVYECLECDEDLYSFEVKEITVNNIKGEGDM